jgi:hypothetical protein
MIFGQGHSSLTSFLLSLCNIAGRPSLSPFFQISEKRKSFIPPSKALESLAYTLDILRIVVLI